MNIISVIENTVPISQFNRGLAGKIFQEVKQSGAKVVMKNNTPECVLLSPQEYIRLIEEINDARLLAVASERMKNYDPSENIPDDEVQHELGITDEELADFEEVEFE
ncbi:MAG: type II toxin-antitoxin system Phd/YefM family antitoxin [Ruminococcus sp.]|nr:type II toxin-antitoxin system Phd/YefM family antitoxin [Ruminococcus sp.]